MKRILLSLLLIPSVSAEECGLLNLASCIPQKMYDFVIDIINAPISPLITFVKSLLTEPVNTSLFLPIWAIMVYIISMFYGLLLLYAGFNFVISGYDTVKREKAKDLLKSTFLMIIFVQASFFIYSMTLEIGSLLTIGTMNLIDQYFFKITADNIINIGLQFFFGIFYVLILFLTAVVLTIRYLIVALGVAIFPLAIALYYMPFSKKYGKMILNFLGICIFVTFFDAIVFLICSKLLEVTLFENMKILVMISALGFVNLMMLYLMFFAILKSALDVTLYTASKVATVSSLLAP